MTRHIPTLIALTSKSNQVSASELTQVAGALQRQANEDLRPAWTHTNVSVLACPDPSRVPHGYAPIIVQDDIGAPGAAGFHTDDNGQPYSLVEYSQDWPLTASHEFVEMALDPLGNTLYRAKSPDPGEPDKHKVVRILLELADPVEDGSLGYEIDGVLLSDFITHQYGNGRTGPFDHTNQLRYCRQVLPGGYISWMEPDGEWRQLTFFGSRPSVRSLGYRSVQDRGFSLREWVDAKTHPKP